jgi:NAD-dependent deacetylase sirtuin 4
VSNAACLLPCRPAALRSGWRGPPFLNMLLPVFEPPHGADAVSALAGLMAQRRVLVLSGAGLSTESGIPDYRSPESLARARTPVTYQAFVKEPSVRQRYWARSVVGWPRMRSRAPNRGHLALARLERAGLIASTVTQNVDGLHQSAGSRNVVELHGALRTVRCLGCGVRLDRDALQERLLELNPGFDPAAAMAPDGDADLSQEQIDGFRVADCERCEGMLKPDVVFFGEHGPGERVERTRALVEAAQVLLVLGSSLAVRSGLRWVEAAARAGTPVAIVNDGPTRGDPHATLRISGRLGEVLGALADSLCSN